MTNIIRSARIDDIQHIVKFVEMASGGITHFLVEDLVEEMTSADLIEMILNDETTPLYYENFLVAEDDGKIVAASNFYSAEEHQLSEIMATFIAEEKLKVIEPYLNSRIPNSLYIHTLSVLPSYRHITVGFNLCRKIEKIAQEKSFGSLSAHVWNGNKLVLNALKLLGFVAIQHLNIPNHPLFEYEGGMVLLKKEIN